MVPGRRAAPLLLSMIALAPGLARAGPPLRTDDPHPAAPASLETIVAFTQEHRQSGDAFETPLLDLSLGVLEGLELGALIGWVVSDESDGGSGSGVGPASVALKWRFVGRTDDAFQAAIAPGVVFDTGDRDVDRGPSQNSFTAYLPLLAAYRLGRWNLGGDFTYQWRPTGGDEWFTGVAVGYQVLESLELLAEVTTLSSLAFEDTDVGLAAGVDFAFHPRWHLLASGGRHVRTGGGDRLEWRTYVGLQVIVGPFF